MGRVVQLFQGDDGKVRSCKVKRTDGELALHSVNHLYPMELSLTHAYNGKAVSPVSESLNEEEIDSNAAEVVSTADTVLEPVDTSRGVVSTEPEIKDARSSVFFFCASGHKLF